MSINRLLKNRLNSNLKSKRIKYSTIFGLLFLNLSIFSCCETVQIEYDETESYVENEPYTEESIETITLTYERISNTISWQRRSGAALFNTLPEVSATLIIKNTSQHDGEFSLNAIITSNDGRVSAFGKKFIAAGQTGEVTAVADVAHYTFQEGLDIESFQIIAPEVTYTKSVTKYREVEKERIISKQRNCKTCEEDCDQYRRI